MDRDQALRNVGTGLRFRVFDTKQIFVLNNGCTAWNALNSEHIEISSILQIIPELLECTVFPELPDSRAVILILCYPG